MCCDEMMVVLLVLGMVLENMARARMGGNEEMIIKTASCE